MKKSFVNTTLALLIGLLIHPLAFAEQSVSYDKYTIHYNAFNSTIVAPNIAKQHGLIRSRYTAMLNVAVFEQQEDGTEKAIPAVLTGKVANLMQQSQQLTFKPIKEGKSLYYIGSFTFGNEEVMHVTINVQPDPNKPAKVIRFDQKFYTE